MADDDLFDALAQLRFSAGQLSYRDIEAATGHEVSKATVHNILHYRRVPPKWASLRHVVLALGGDEQKFRRLWEHALIGARGAQELAEVPEVLSRAAELLRKHGRGGVRQSLAIRVLESESARLSRLT